jgi:uncharacterized protein (DUF2147 family)
MKTLTLAAILLLASTAAHAGQAISLEIDGHRIRIEAPNNCDALSCLKITGLDGINLGRLTSGHDDDTPASPSTAPAPAPAPAVQASAPQATPPAASPPPPALAAATMASVAAATQTTTGNHVASAASIGASITPPPPAPAPIAANPPPATASAPTQSTPVAAAPAPAPTTPLGLWATEENKGNVRIESCGANLCGYAEKSGEKILINMKPSDNKWVGRIHDPEGGSNYDSTIAMKGPNLLKVQGCAFGGLFCGGQTWKRLS